MDTNVTNSFSELEEEFSQEHKEICEEARAKGSQDGRANIPAVDASFNTPFEKGTIYKYQSWIEKIGKSGGTSDPGSPR